MFADNYFGNFYPTLPSRLISRTYGISWHLADLLHSEQIHSLLNAVHPTHLLHLAWYSEPACYWQSAENYRWLKASIDLIRAFQRYGGKRIVVAGTCAEYDWRQGLCSEALTPCRPSSLYGKCKHALQQTLQAMTMATDLSAAWGRVFFLYGPREHPSRLVPSTVLSLLRGEKATCSHGHLVRDYLHVEDAAEALAALVDSPVNGPVNIASGTPLALGRLVASAAACLGVTDRLEVGTAAPAAGEAPVLLATVRRLRSEVGFVPRFDLEAGMANTVAWWKSRCSPEVCAMACEVGRRVS